METQLYIAWHFPTVMTLSRFRNGTPQFIVSTERRQTSQLAHFPSFPPPRAVAGWRGEMKAQKRQRITGRDENNRLQIAMKEEKTSRNNTNTNNRVYKTGERRCSPDPALGKTREKLPPFLCPQSMAKVGSNISRELAVPLRAPEKVNLALAGTRIYRYIVPQNERALSS